MLSWTSDGEDGEDGKKKWRLEVLVEGLLLCGAEVGLVAVMMAQLWHTV